MSDPFWFQSLGAVMGMDWHSSGITTSVMGALKRVINPNAKTLGIYICGGKGKFSKETPAELLKIANATGLNGYDLVHSSKLSAKVDNTAMQDGFQLYTHNFIVSDEGNWTVVQQGMDAANKTARRYHWHSDNINIFYRRTAYRYLRNKPGCNFKSYSKRSIQYQTTYFKIYDRRTCICY